MWETTEWAILAWIRTNLQCGFLDALMPAVSWICNHGEVWILLALCLLASRKHRSAGAAVACALALDLVMCNLLIKPWVARLRPYDVYAGVELLIPKPSDFSFPSGHTAASFAAVAALKHAGDPWWIPSLVLAILIAFSRLYLLVHWPSDVLGGVLVGWLCGWAGQRLWRRYLACGRGGCALRKRKK